MLAGGGDRTLRILQIKLEDKSFAKISSKDQTSFNGESSFRVNYYNGVSGAVPFTWETRPGTPKHPLTEETSLPPLTPPPSYMFKQISTDSSKKKSNKSKIFNSIFPRFSFREEKGSAYLSSSSVSSSSFSSSFSASSTPRDRSISRSCRNNGNRRSRSLVNFGLDEDEDNKDQTSAAAMGKSMSCFGGGAGGRGYRSSGGGEGKLRMYRPVKNMKNTLLYFVGGRGTA